MVNGQRGRGGAVVFGRDFDPSVASIETMKLTAAIGRVESG